MRFEKPACPTALSGPAVVVPSLDVPANPIGLDYLAAFDREDRAVVLIPVTGSAAPDETVAISAKSLKAATDQELGTIRDERLEHERVAVPPVRLLVDKVKERDRTVQVSIDVKLLAQVARAIGTHMVTLELAASGEGDFCIDMNAPIVVRPSGVQVLFTDGREPVGLVMGIG